jgi:hypothetical protein
MSIDVELNNDYNTSLAMSLHNRNNATTDRSISKMLNRAGEDSNAER